MVPLFAEDEIVPPLKQLSEISVDSNGAWFVDIRPDGSGRIQFGQQYRGWGVFPKGSFSFEEIYNQLKPALQKEGNIREFVGVAMRRPGQVTVSSVYLKDENIALKIYRKAFAKAGDYASPGSRAGMDQTLKKCPFILPGWK
jgi:hypothetical protein